MRWYEIGIRIYENTLEEPISAFLFQLGASGTYTEQKKGSLLIKGYIPEELLSSDLHQRTERFLKELYLIFKIKKTDFYVKELKEVNWVDNWKSFFRPIRVSKDLLILPAWESKDMQIKHTIRIDPGPAFGTGQHPTTQLCLRALETLSCEMDKGWNMLDIGTGTGILAIYGIMLGITNAVAIDIDPVALKWAEHNIKLNGLSDRITLSSDPVSNISGKFHIIVANLLFNEIKDIISYIPAILKKYFIISGLLKEQLRQLESLLNKHGLGIKGVTFQKDWICTICYKV